MTARFKKVLVANRGEIALRVLRCLRELGIPSVIVYHAVDCDSTAVQTADEAVEIRGDTPAAAYLDIEQIVDVCKTHEIDAVHPGYGFLAENADFACALNKAGVTFVGPSVEAIELMGDKIRSREFVEKHGFPVPPSVSMDVDDPGFVKAVEEMGFPVVIKASAGGGGKGMSIVRSSEELDKTIRVAASEAEKYFGDKRVYVERYFENTRHIEVQVLGDGENVVHLFERECSIQRRFQKVVEEAPSPALDDEQRAAICETAVGIAKAANYSSAGTVEFLYTQEGEYFFLEMNTRIQVEHPVTEMVTGVDLVAEQLRVAAGLPLRLAQNDITLYGHAIECRLCAEDPGNDFLPETGRVLYVREPTGEGVRFDSSLYRGLRVTVAFDPMLAKLIVHGADRDAATMSAVAALAETVVLGVRTNAAYLARILQLPAFADGATDTGFLPRHADALLDKQDDPRVTNAALAVGLLSERGYRAVVDATPAPYGEIGRWRN